MKLSKIPRDKFIHDASLAIALPPAAFFLVFLAGDSTRYLLEGKYGVIPLFIMILVTVSGYVLAWKRARTGGIVMSSGGFAMAVYIVLMGGWPAWYAGITFGLPFMIPGILLLLVSERKGSSEQMS